MGKIHGIMFYNTGYTLLYRALEISINMLFKSKLDVVGPSYRKITEFSGLGILLLVQFLLLLLPL